MLMQTRIVFKFIGLLPLLTIILTGCGGSSSSTPTATTPVTFALKLSSESTVPQVDASGSGTGSLTLNRDSGLLSGSVTVSGLSSNITVAHIHSAIAGLAGLPIITLQQDATNTLLLTVPANTTLDAVQITAIQNSEYYINVHTDNNPAGEVRGQIVAANQQVIRVELRGENEVPLEVNSMNTATAYVTVDAVSGDIRGNIRNFGLDDALVAHIHTGFAGISGIPQTTLIPDTGDVALWLIEDNTTLDASQLASLLAGGLYFNVHTPSHTGGEVRGQIIAQNIELERVSLSGEFEIPAVNSAGSAVGYLTVNEDTGAVTVNIITDGLVDTTAAHVHSGLAGINGVPVVTLTKDMTDTSLFSSTTGATLNAMALSEFFEAKLYLNVHTGSNLAGEVRAQLTPRNTRVIRSVLEGAQEIPPVITSASGVGYTTVNEDDGSIDANIRTRDITAIAAHIHSATLGNTGGIELFLIQDMSDTDFWSESAILDAVQLNAFVTDGLYFNVHSDGFMAGEIRAQINR